MKFNPYYRLVGQITFNQGMFMKVGVCEWIKIKLWNMLYDIYESRCNNAIQG